MVGIQNRSQKFKTCSGSWSSFKTCPINTCPKKCSPVPLTSLFLDLFSQLNQDLFLDIFRFHYYLFKILKNFKKWMSHNLWLILRNISLITISILKILQSFIILKCRYFCLSRVPRTRTTTAVGDYRGWRMVRRALTLSHPRKNKIRVSRVPQ